MIRVEEPYDASVFITIPNFSPKQAQRLQPAPQTTKKLKKPDKAVVTVPQLIETIEGSEWLTFNYTHKGISTSSKMKIDILDTEIATIPIDYKSENSIYVNANVPRDSYRGNRWTYETSVNELGWKLAWVNPGMFEGKRGLLQRAVDCFRNTLPGFESRRLVRVTKKATKVAAKAAKTKLGKRKPAAHIPFTTNKRDTEDCGAELKAGSVESFVCLEINGLNESSPSNNNTPEPIIPQELHTDKKRKIHPFIKPITEPPLEMELETVRNQTIARQRVRIDFESLEGFLIPDNIKLKFIIFPASFLESAGDAEKMRMNSYNEVGWKLTALNPEVFDVETDIVTLQKCVDAYMFNHEPLELWPPRRRLRFQTLNPDDSKVQK